MREKLLDIITSAVDELNEDLDYESLDNVSESTQLFGGDDSIDSLSLINLISKIEKNIHDELNLKIVLADERAMAYQESPFSNVGNLLNFTLKRLNAIEQR